jgi:acetate kinase
MGFTPMQGSIMGTRCGLIDPSIPQYLMDVEHISSKEVSNILNKKSGLLGLSNISSDMRMLEENISDPRAKRAIDVFCYRLQKLIGGYVSALEGLEIIIFTAGIGENSPLVRAKICESLKYLGLELDEEKNQRSAEEISTKNSKIRVLVLKTNEELQMVREAKELLEK